MIQPKAPGRGARVKGFKVWLQSRKELRYKYKISRCFTKGLKSKSRWRLLWNFRKERIVKKIQLKWRRKKAWWRNKSKKYDCSRQACRLQLSTATIFFGFVSSPSSSFLSLQLDLRLYLVGCRQQDTDKRRELSVSMGHIGCRQLTHLSTGPRRLSTAKS